MLPEEHAERAIEILRTFPVSRNVCRIGRVTSGPAGQVLLTSHIGIGRILDMLSGKQLPRIC